jgi:hypothetical protein
MPWNAQSKNSPGKFSISADEVLDVVPEEALEAKDSPRV